MQDNIGQLAPYAGASREDRGFQYRMAAGVFMLNILRVPFLGSECGPSEGKDPRSIDQRDCGDGTRFDDLIKAARPQALLSSIPAQIAHRFLLDGNPGAKDSTPSIAQKRIASSKGADTPEPFRGIHLDSKSTLGQHCLGLCDSKFNRPTGVVQSYTHGRFEVQGMGPVAHSVGIEA
ncbi:unnamed protein product [Clonostachys byssicola]|uniref:Uncharacterized protein n=1 Tax=Clonostachys byssicola TaxID=160290 RepID=A0A9N9UUY3_9HYPO|nr:unnamed protein product [Clonostachys byssicola]